MWVALAAPSSLRCPRPDRARRQSEIDPPSGGWQQMCRLHEDWWQGPPAPLPLQLQAIKLDQIAQEGPFAQGCGGHRGVLRGHNPAGNVKPSGEWNDDAGAGHVDLLLGGQHGGATVGAQVSLSDMRPKGQELFNRVYGGQGWSLEERQAQTGGGRAEGNCEVLERCNAEP